MSQLYWLARENTETTVITPHSCCCVDCLRLQVQEDGLTCLAAACLATTISSAGLQTPAPSLIDICAALGCCSSSEAAELQQQLQQALKSDTSATSVSNTSGHVLRLLTAFLQACLDFLQPAPPAPLVLQAVPRLNMSKLAPFAPEAFPPTSHDLLSSNRFCSCSTTPTFGQIRIT